MSNIQLMMWEDAQENPPPCRGFFLVWLVPVFSDDTEGYSIAYFDGYNKWKETSAPNSIRVPVSHWMMLPGEPDRLTTYPSDAILKDVTVRAATDELYEALRKFQTIMALTQ